MSLTVEGDSGGAAHPSYSWPEVWGRIGLVADVKISTVQAELIAEVLGREVVDAVDDGVLEETYFQAPAPDDGSERHTAATGSSVTRSRTMTLHLEHGVLAMTSDETHRTIIVREDCPSCNGFGDHFGNPLMDEPSPNTDG